MEENITPSLEGEQVVKEPVVRKKKTLVYILVLFLIFLAVGIFVYSKKDLLFNQKTNDKSILPTELAPTLPPAAIVNSSFAQFKEISVSIDPKIAPIKPEADFSNVVNMDDFDWLADNLKEKLLKNSFVVFQGWNKEFFPLYESNRYGYVPNFITTDSVFHSYHLLFNYLLENIEKEKLFDITKNLTLEMLALSKNQLSELRQTKWENAAKRNIAFFSVGAKLLDDNFQIPEEVKEAVEMELKLIAEHGNIAISPVVNLGMPEAGGKIDPNTWPTEAQKKAFKEDYTQYIPRGHYETDELLQKYFKAMMWYGRATFRFKEEDEIRSAALLTVLLKNEKTLPLWREVDEVIGFFVGKADDVDYYLFEKQLAGVYGENYSEKDLLIEDKFPLLINNLSKLQPPAINSIPIYRNDIQPDKEAEIKGFRFMGQKFTVDASIFQKLICREVGTKNGSMNCGGGIPGSRMLPKGLDIPSVLGSSEAYALLTSEGETEYKLYPENTTELKKYLTNLPTSNWTQNLYWSWIYSLRPVLEKRGNGYPLFMQNTAWLRKQLNLFLGSWTELKHDTILYAKQVYAEMGAGMPEEKDDRGYVEPEPEVYARLAALVKMTKEGLTSRNIINSADEEVLGIMEDLCLSLKTISEKELKNEKLTEEEYELIRGYGGSLEHLYMKALEDKCKDKDARQCLDDNPAALVADVATDPNGQVLEEAIGNINEIYVLVPVEGKLKMAKGGVFSYYEFPWPMNDRLTDSKWRQMLDEYKTPELPDWTQEFMEKAR